MIDGFIPHSRASFMLDFVAIAMLAVIPLMGWSIYVVKYRRDYALHRKVQLLTACVLLAAVLLFEVDMRLYGWRHLAEESSLYRTLVDPILYIHLGFAITTTALWAWTVIGALRRFRKTPAPNGYSSRHRRVAKLAAVGMCGTAVTGWGFYITAFML